MIKIILTSIIIFSIILLVLIALNVKIEYFDDMFISNKYTILYDKDNNIIEPYIWYKFENNLNDSGTGKKDLSIARSSVSYNNSIVIKGKQSIYFNGNLYLQNRNISFNIPFTISLWYYNFYNGQYQTLIALNSNNIVIFHFDLEHRDNGYYAKVVVAINTHWTVIYSPLLNYEKWYLYTLTVSINPQNNLAEAKFYVNGNFHNKLLGSSSRLMYIPNILYLGTNGESFVRNFKGYVNDFRIYNVALTDDQIFELYSGYKKIGEVIDTSTNCVANMNSSGIIKRIPDTDFNITNISNINKINDYIFNQSFNNAGINYTLTFSRYLDNDYIPTNLLLRNNKKTIFYDSINRDNYDENGNYIGIFSRNTNIIPNLNNYPQKGDFIHIRLISSSTSSFSDVPIKLKRYGFTADEQRLSRAPGTWALYAGTRLLEPSNTNRTLLVNNTTRLNNNSYCSANQNTYIHDISTNQTSANELLFIFTSLADFGRNNNSGGVLSFVNLLLFT